MKTALVRKLVLSLAATTAIILPATVTLTSPALADTTLPLGSLPHYSGGPLGGQSEPVSFIYVGNEQQISDLYTNHGWYGADPLTPANLLRAYNAARTNAPYPTAPFSPAFIDGHHQDLAFQMPTAANTIAQRHHTRIWDTPYTTSDGRPVWVGTASFDQSVGPLGPTRLPIHHISPDLDTERNFIVGTLGISPEYVPFNNPGTSRNTLGDPMYTDGQAAVIDLSGQAQSTAPASDNIDQTADDQAAAPQPAATTSTQPAVYTSPNALTKLQTWLHQSAAKAGLPIHLF